jgi:hypothetical protein
MNLPSTTNVKTSVNTVVSNYEKYYTRILPTGSKVIVSEEDQEKSPPKDEDYLLLVSPEALQDFEQKLTADDWTLGGSMPNGSAELATEHSVNSDGRLDMTRVFHSWKRYETPGVEKDDPEAFFRVWEHPPVGPELNLLVTCNEQYFEDFTRATFLSRALNLTDKADRVVVFEALTRDVWPTERKKKDFRTFYKYLIYNGTLDQMLTQGSTELNNIEPPNIQQVVNVEPSVWQVSWGAGTLQ